MIKYTVDFEVIGEIRMGSPFNGARVLLSGPFVPDLSGHTFQDKAAVSEDGLECLLVQWEMKDGEPGFRVWKIDGTNQKVVKSKRFEGCCEDIQKENGLISLKIWKWDASKKIEVNETQKIEF